MIFRKKMSENGVRGATIQAEDSGFSKYGPWKQMDIKKNVGALIGNLWFLESLEPPGVKNAKKSIKILTKVEFRSEGF